MSGNTCVVFVMWWELICHRVNKYILVVCVGVCVLREVLCSVSIHVGMKVDAKDA